MEVNINGVASNYKYETSNPQTYYYETTEKTTVPIYSSTSVPQSKQVKVVEKSDNDDFEATINALINEGYRILSTNCGFSNSENYDFSPLYQAILIR